MTNILVFFGTLMLIWIIGTLVLHTRSYAKNLDKLNDKQHRVQIEKLRSRYMKRVVSAVLMLIVTLCTGTTMFSITIQQSRVQANQRALPTGVPISITVNE